MVNIMIKNEQIYTLIKNHKNFGIESGTLEKLLDALCEISMKFQMDPCHKYQKELLEILKSWNDLCDIAQMDHLYEETNTPLEDVRCMLKDQLKRSKR